MLALAGYAWVASAAAPFSGRAFLRRGPDGRSSWTGSLTVPILGGRPMRLTGSVFETHFGPGG